MMECFCENNEQLKGVIYSQNNFIMDVAQGCKYASGLNFKNFSVQFTLDQKLNRCWINFLSTHSWQNFKTSAEKKFSSVNKYFQFSWEFLKYKENTFFSRTYPGRLLLKSIYWNKSIQRIKIISLQMNTRNNPNNNG